VARSADLCRSTAWDIRWREFVRPFKRGEMDDAFSETSKHYIGGNASSYLRGVLVAFLSLLDLRSTSAIMRS